MPKKSSLNPNKLNTGETAKVEEKKPSSTPKKMGAEIDDIFAVKKRKKDEAEKSVKKTKNKAANERRKERKKRRIEGSTEGKTLDAPSRSRKKTSDGLTIYSEEELGIGKVDAGGTPLCPFDCSCCF